MLMLHASRVARGAAINQNPAAAYGGQRFIVILRM
jgi:hypothetical protein